jgi:hypothetical protein
LSSIQGRIEPAVLVAFIQYGLQRRETCRHGQDPDPGSLRQQSEPHRLALQRQPQGDDQLKDLSASTCSGLVSSGWATPTPSP